jgi:eukaryotic-like serine/threonine-protein kinase
MPGLDLGTVVALLRGSRLLSPEQFGQLEGLRRAHPEPVALVRAVLGRGWLTSYQARELFAGRGRGLVLGDYHVLDRLGEGATAHVLKARHRRTGRLVALKVARPGPGYDATVGCLYREGLAGARLAHPNVLRAYGAVHAGGAHFLVLEYAEGADLARLVGAQGPLPPGRACDYARQAALGLQHAHERGLVHRDVKPSNLFLTAPGAVVKILDLGLALPAPAAPGSSVTAGTPDYMAPEQVLGPAAADARSDVYGLGCALYFLLTGRPPFPGGTAEDKLRRRQADEPPPPERLRPELPAGVGDVVLRMMAREPTDRYATAGAAAADLAAFAEPGGCDDRYVLEIWEGDLASLDPEQATIMPEPG